MNLWIQSIKSGISKYSPLLFLSICFLLIVTPIPSMGIAVIFITFILFSLGIVIWKKTRKQFSMIFPKLINWFCIVFLGIAIATTRSFLTEEIYENQILIFRLVGEFICKENELYGFISVVCFGALICYVIYRISKYTWDQNFAKTRNLSFRINRQLIKQDISRTQADQMNKRIYQLEDYYHSVSQVLEYLGDIYKALISIFVIDVAGGTLIGVFFRNQNWQEVVRQSIALFSGFFVLMSIPLSIVSISFKINEEEYLTSVP